MQRIIRLVFALCLTICSSVPAELPMLKVAITHTTDNSGVMALLNPVFESHTGIKVQTVTIGSGHALRLGRSGDVDVLLTHAPKDEITFIDEGHGLSRHLVMYNDYILLGPKSDPARVKQADSAIEGLNFIKQNQMMFVSRGDESGTHKKELSIWEQINVIPAGEWYISSGMGMGQSLLLANEKQAYILSDRATWLAFHDRLDLELIYESPEELRNPYHVIAINPKTHATAQSILAEKYVEFLLGSIAQQIIDEYRVNAEPLFYPAKQLSDHRQLSKVDVREGNYF